MGNADALSLRLEETLLRIDEACRRCGRRREEVTLVGVSKGQPIEKLQAAYEAGLRVFGENRVQEAEAKVPRLPADVQWHLIGPLQSNKAKKAADLFHVIHTVDRMKIARRLDREATGRGAVLPCFLEVNVGREERKHGFDESGLTGAFEELAGLDGLKVVGLMAIPPYEENPRDARRWFRKLRALRDRMVAAPGFEDSPGWLSMGMSHDFPEAIEEGATHVRVGTAVFGERVPFAG